MKSLSLILAISASFAPLTAGAEEENPFDPNQYLLNSELEKAAELAAQNLEFAFVEFHGREFLALTSTSGSILVAMPTDLSEESLSKSHCVVKKLYDRLSPSMRFYASSQWEKSLFSRKNQLLATIKQTCKTPGSEPLATAKSF
jgi:hypothetical protein